MWHVESLGHTRWQVASIDCARAPVHRRAENLARTTVRQLNPHSLYLRRSYSHRSRGCASEPIQDHQ
jgi:hypothetical protein